MIAKRPTKKLQELGFTDIEVHKGLWGFYLFDKNMKNQRATCYKTSSEAIGAAREGKLPTEVQS